MSNIGTNVGVRSIDPMKSNVSRRNHSRVYTATLAHTNETLQDAFRLRHACYVDSGFIEPRPDKIFSDRFDALPSSATIVVYDESGAVASVRVCFLSRQEREAPVHHAFRQEVDAIMDTASSSKADVEAAEITRLVRSPDCANNQGLVFLLYRLAGHLVLANDVQVILSSVRRNHVPFYHRLGFVDVAGPRPYPGLNCPMHLLKCPRSEYDRVRAAFPLMNPDATPPGTFDDFVSGRPITMPLSFGS